MVILKALASFLLLGFVACLRPFSNKLDSTTFLEPPLGKFRNNRYNLRVGILTPEEEEKLEGLLGKKVSNLSNQELMTEIINRKDPDLDEFMDDVLDIGKLPTLKNDEIFTPMSENPPLNSREDEDEDNTTFKDPTLGEFKLKYNNKEEQISMAKNAVAHILEDEGLLVVPMKEVTVNNENIEKIYWRDSHKNIELWIPLKRSFDCKQIKITFISRNIKVAFKDMTLLDLQLSGPIIGDESVWESNNKEFPELPIKVPQTIHIVTTKRSTHEHIWKYLLRSN